MSMYGLMYILVSIVAGASLVQWNRINENIIASAHDSDIRIWDLRVRERIVDVIIIVCMYVYSDALLISTCMPVVKGWSFITLGESERYIYGTSTYMYSAAFLSH